MESCGFGKALNDDCHKIYFVRKKGFKDFCNLEKDFQDIFGGLACLRLHHTKR